MTKTIVSKGHTPSPTVTWRKRYDAAFRRIDPKVQIVKANPAAQIAAGTTVAALLLSGRLTSAAVLAGAWVGSKPLTHAAAAGIACAGTLNDAAKQAIQRFRTPTPTTPERRRPAKTRRRRTKAQVAISPVPVA